MNKRLPSPFSTGQDAPAYQLIEVVPDTANDLASPARALFVGTGGDISVIALGDETPVVLKNVPSGSMLAVRAKRVLALDAGTTATDIVAVY